MPRKKKEEITKEVKTTSKVAPSKISFYQAIGRRKESTARVRLTVGGKGEITINNRPAPEYFSGEIAKFAYLQPFQLTDNLGRFEVTVKVEGGGMTGQLGAVIHGIARAIEKIDKEKYRPLLKKAGLLKRDPRKKQRIKAGFAGKSRAKKQSPKR
ncbi:MAG: 30S ribosomal protein S9 [Patescibacteria group bacterium]|nr:30S ribosomal protein S9 [Patescibacteria group bacterium]MCL5095543.1 30S ribosomal protein S9 [Patescibacteria group bacterium]